MARRKKNKDNSEKEMLLKVVEIPADAAEELGEDFPRPKKRHFVRNFLLLLLCFLLLAVFAPFFHVQSITVKGNTYISAEDVCRIAGLHQGDSIFLVQPEALAAALKQDLRIEEAQAERVFPNGIALTVKESKPVATIACDYGYLDLNQKGEVLDAYKYLKQMKIPMITGIEVHDLYIGDKVDNETMLGMLDFLAALDSSTLNQLSEVSIADPEHIVIYTTGAAQIRLGNLDRLEDKEKKTRSFLADMVTQKRPVEYVDFSYTLPSIKFRQ